MVDDAKLHQFMGQMLSDLGGAASVTLVRIGDALGLYKALHERGPMTAGELAAAAGVNGRYLRDALEAIDTPEVLLQITGPSSPGIIRPAGEPNGYCT